MQITCPKKENLMNNLETVFRYTAEKQLYPVTDTSSSLIVTDSFLVSDGMARAPELHAARFFESCRIIHGSDPEGLIRFWQLAMAKIPEKGQWFPRIELAKTGKTPQLQIRIRPAPEQQNQIRLIHGNIEDKRTQPRHKGPDIAWLSLQRKNIAALGADEGILCTPSHYLLEGFFSSILWWEKDTLCQTPPSKRVLPSVTATLIRQIAAKRGIPTAYCFRRLPELNGCETWAVNALHGIRRAVNWPLSPWSVNAYANCDEWKKSLTEHALRPILGNF